MTQTLSSGYVHSLPSVFLSPYSKESMAAPLRGGPGGANSPATAVYIAANRIMYYPFSIPVPVIVYRYFWCNGTTASTNNIQVGVYNGDATVRHRGTSTLAAGPSAAQFDNITDYVLPAGNYFMAIWCNGTTTHLIRSATPPRLISGAYQEAGGAGGLPSPSATFTEISSTYLPLFGLALRASP